MKKHWNYLKYVLKHKYYVYKAGRKLGLGRWQLLIHDLSKFSRAEWGPYVQWFYDRPEGGLALDYKRAQKDFAKAWEHHWKNNPHHWEFFAYRDFQVKMPERFAREMIADWYGAGKAKTGKADVQGWYLDTKDKMVLHPTTRDFIEDVIFSDWFDENLGE